MMEEKNLDKLLRQLTLSVNVLALGIMVSTVLLLGFAVRILPFEYEEISGVTKFEGEGTSTSPESVWQAPLLTEVPANREGDLIRYGHELIAHTSVYLGRNGKIRQISNGMNCQNCHLNGGTVPYGNNYGAVASKYPVFRKFNINMGLLAHWYLLISKLHSSVMSNPDQIHPWKSWVTFFCFLLD